jgi:hypothetical protein
MAASAAERWLKSPTTVRPVVSWGVTSTGKSLWLMAQLLVGETDDAPS